jgi:4-methyl-5(b-hydroxyethyl)-thiazole monophosphate biosynthesis
VFGLVKALVFLAPGFEEIETITIVDILRRCNVEVTVAGLRQNVVGGAHGIKVVPDKYIDEADLKEFDAVVLPGGSPGYINLRKDRRVLTMVKAAFESKKLVAAICASPAVLSDAGILKDRICTIYPGMEGELVKGGGNPIEDLVVVDANIITSRGPATALLFALKLAERLAGKKVAEEVKKTTLADLVKK